MNIPYMYTYIYIYSSKIIMNEGMKKLNVGYYRMDVAV